MKKHTFAMANLAFIALLSLIKWWNLPPEIEEPFLYTPRFKMDTTIFDLPSYSYSISKKLISNDQFNRFVEETNFVTWREQKNITPNWRTASIDPEEAVSWIIKEDAVKFCQWFAKKYNLEKQQPRLPTCQELDLLFEKNKLSAHWELTNDDLSSVDKTLPNSKEFLTLKKANTPLKHRKTEDMGLKDTPETSFRIVWTN